MGNQRKKSNTMPRQVHHNHHSSMATMHFSPVFDEEGPNINIKLPRKSNKTVEEKTIFKNHIQAKKKTEVFLVLLSYARIGICTGTAISRIHVLLLMVRLNLGEISHLTTIRLNLAKALRKDRTATMEIDANTLTLFSTLTINKRMRRVLKNQFLLSRYCNDVISEIKKTQDDLLKSLQLIHLKKQFIM